MEEQKKVKKNKLINRVFYYTYLNHRTNCNYIIFIVTTLLHNIPFYTSFLTKPLECHVI